MKMIKVYNDAPLSVARIFFRNAVNIGLAPIECKEISRVVKTGDEIEVDIEKGEVKILRTGEILKFKPWPPVVREILKAGGMIEYIKRGGVL